MEGYWKSPDLSFFSAAERSWVGMQRSIATARPYQAEVEKWVNLHLSELDIQLLGPEAAVRSRPMGAGLEGRNEAGWTLYAYLPAISRGVEGHSRPHIMQSVRHVQLAFCMMRSYTLASFFVSTT
jgi:hypothetical protein